MNSINKKNVKEKKEMSSHLIEEFYGFKPEHQRMYISHTIDDEKILYVTFDKTTYAEEDQIDGSDLYCIFANNNFVSY